MSGPDGQRLFLLQHHVAAKNVRQRDFRPGDRGTAKSADKYQQHNPA